MIPDVCTEDFYIQVGESENDSYGTFTHNEIRPDIFTLKNGPLLFSIVSMSNGQNGF